MWLLDLKIKYYLQVKIIQITISTFFPSIGKTLEEITLSLSNQIIFLPPLIMILPQFVEIGGIIYAAPISDLIAFLIAVAFLIPELKKIPHSDEAQIAEKYKINMLNPIQNKVL